MQSKSLLIAIAAFAVTATGVHAYAGAEILSRAGLSEEQVTAFEKARELRASGDFVAARDKLVEAGVDEETLKAIREATRAAREAVHEAVLEGDYKTFKANVAGSPLADIITSEEDFKQFREAQDLKRAGDWEAAHTILDELGIERGSKGNHGNHHGLFRQSGPLTEFTDEQREALKVAKQANDRATIQAIFDEAGVEFGHHRGGQR